YAPVGASSSVSSSSTPISLGAASCAGVQKRSASRLLIPVGRVLRTWRGSKHCLATIGRRHLRTAHNDSLERSSGQQRGVLGGLSVVGERSGPWRALGRARCGTGTAVRGPTSPLRTST